MDYNKLIKANNPPKDSPFQANNYDTNHQST